MKVQSFSLNSDDEVVVKVVKEILNLFKISVEEDAQYQELKLENNRLSPPGEVPVKLLTRMTLVNNSGEAFVYEEENKSRFDEYERAAFHRLVKLNFYHLLRKNCNMPPAPWGILHGVRPTKIVHRFLKSGFDFQETVDRLIHDYEVSPEKASYITELSVRQIPFLDTAKDNLVSIYIGIPFCLSRCLYCSFPSYVLTNKKQLDDFMDAFAKDLYAAKQLVVQHGLEVQNIYIGGGTPTSLPDEYFDTMLKSVYEAFYGKEIREFTVEAGRPDSMSRGKINSMLAYRVNRVSVNPQTMNEKTLKRIGRNHTPQAIVEMYHDLKHAGIEQINMDLIIGLPGETVKDVDNTMKQIETLRPDDVTLHSLALKKGSALKMQLSDYELPDDDTAREMFDSAMGYISKWGLKPYYLYRQGYQSGQLENVGCCRPGAESMYNIQIMEERQTIIGIGGSATSKIVFPKTGRLKSVFMPKELSIYLEKTDLYIEKRRKMIDEAYGEQEEEN